jgi:hypothetical protein
MKEKDFPSATGVLLIGALLLIASAGGLQAQGGNQPVFSSGFQRGVAGLYVGTLDFTPLGIPSLEPIALRLDQLGGAILVSFHEGSGRTWVEDDWGSASSCTAGGPPLAA